jgi:hypothetical protein
MKVDSKFKSLQPHNNTINNMDSQTNNLGVAPVNAQPYHQMDNKRAFSSFTSFAKVESHISEATLNSDINKDKAGPQNFKRDNTRQQTNKNKPEDASVFDIVHSTRNFTEEDIKKAPVLLIEELSGDVLRNIKLIINAGGLVNGIRKLKDGVAFFGKNSKTENFVNDFELNMNLDHQASNCVFIIYYKKGKFRIY